MPAARASSTGMPKPSKVDGKTHAEAPAYNWYNSSRGIHPVRRTESPTFNSAIRDFTAFT